MRILAIIAAAISTLLTVVFIIFLGVAGLIGIYEGQFPDTYWSWGVLALLACGLSISAFGLDVTHLLLDRRGLRLIALALVVTTVLILFALAQQGIVLVDEAKRLDSDWRFLSVSSAARFNVWLPLIAAALVSVHTFVVLFATRTSRARQE